MKVIYHNKDYCLGCKLCEVACITHKSDSKDFVKAFKKEIKPLPGLFFEESDNNFLALQCRHCEDSPCINYCMTGALYKNEDGLVLHNPDKCVGCWMCIMACPYGVIKPNFATVKVATKCDACIDEDTPWCVQYCPNEALVLKDLIEEKGA